MTQNLIDKMFSALAAYFSDKINLTPQELELMETHCVSKVLKKKEFLLQEGEVCRFSAFVVSGCLRSYRLDDGGNEHTFKFVVKDWWITDNESYSNGTPAQYNIQALEESELVIVAKESFLLLLEQIPLLKPLVDRLQSNSYNASQQRIYKQISATPEERYLAFVEEYPDIFNRVPLHMVASYLGMSRETLTRVRSHFAKGK
ncbi:Crp/Fnr family transcriptional regulator [Chitinophaga sp. LS1]|uniref:Crp/Fnr family transcriptional regulator n=1 Tax=Chitinophaga sp. LS1 TaxID=3051176 RepID=UPI002AAAA347|nr:Crp/Fnr family transcriptional regulator [Chitinophaga sp. LS1]WPV67990.1 Crp/Fnr family transcriptional regulator [Chitinophaga sp. LS1]